MTVGILLITHDNIGCALLNTVKKTFGYMPLPAVAVSIDHDIDPILNLAKLRSLLIQLENGDGVLILTDLYGSTPSNLAQALQKERRVRIVSGLNLPMLMRIMNYPQLNLIKLVEKAISGGREGVFNCVEHV